MTRRQLTTWIVVGALAAAALTVASLKRNEPSAPKAQEAAEPAAKQAADETPMQIQEAPQRTQDVFMPPATDATGTSPAPK